MKRVLIIKLAALGDFVQGFGAMKRIREAHPHAELTLLTTPPYAALAYASGLFERVETDGRPASWSGTLRLLRRLRRARYDRVYDLQTSGRSSAYFQALRPDPPEWSGIARGCSHPHANPARNGMHTLERQAEQLRDAGIWPDAPVRPGEAPPPDLSFILDGSAPERRAEHFGLTPPYALLIPGASPARPAKRWPAERFGRLAAALVGQGLQVAILGAAAEAEAATVILEACPTALDLTCRTDLVQIAALGAGAALAVANDTGPAHLAAAAGAPTLVLFSSESDPRLCAPRGRRVSVLREPSLADLSVEVVQAEVDRLLAAP